MLENDILKQLKDEITEYEYNTYISKMKYDENTSKSDLAVFIVPNIYIANWIKTKYSEKIIHLFEIYKKIKPEISIIVESQKKDVKSSKNYGSKLQTRAILNPSYTFDSFVVGDSNRFCYEIAKKISQRQAEVYNPVLIYGGTGLGKTHILNAIGNSVSEKNKIVIYVTAEQFLNDFITRINNNTMDRFRDKYRSCDYLLIDDVQFFGGKEGVQQEFFHTFNELHDKKKQIVMTSDKPPKQILGLEERLKSRFEWGIIADIQPPGLETKIAIIIQKCHLNQIEIDREIIHYLASNINDNIRQIEGIILKLNAQASIIGQNITLAMAKNAIKDTQKENLENITLENIIKIVSKELNIKPSEIKSKSRNKTTANARRIVIYLARTLTPNSMPALAQFLNMKDHSSVSKAMKMITTEIAENINIKSMIEEMKNKIQNEQNNKII
ncbi:chromosomal replication initiation protein DnaA [Helicobacter sp. 12S02232-10]|uniref:chromosomal replication initiator protein DnaA n=1 Tax=Helicobacter sp. 12S02232-10 TaxID=1476197 RepID=UPI000BA6EE40|nr:chromosomal replication initiator protein DnaA [Helicobacter sp. 12S02232-10]PAF49422.1 chromosomal replication initiation protein DnaA [Helicobacter sp. 12S02232-10]